MRYENIGLDIITPEVRAIKKRRDRNGNGRDTNHHASSVMAPIISPNHLSTPTVADAALIPRVTRELSKVHMNLARKLEFFMVSIEDSEDKKDNVAWRKVWLMAIRELRHTIKDAVDLFGFMEHNELGTGAMIDMRIRLERIVSWWEVTMPGKLSELVLLLDAPITDDERAYVEEQAQLALSEAML